MFDLEKKLSHRAPIVSAALLLLWLGLTLRRFALPTRPAVDYSATPQPSAV